MPRTAVASSGETLRAVLSPLSGASGDYDPLLDLIGDSRVVLLGEASHGTHEFYRERPRITQRLVEERGFTVVAVEADWPDAYRVNRWIRGTSDDTSAAEALGDFERFPRSMWRNRDVLAFISWSRIATTACRRAPGRSAAPLQERERKNASSRAQRGIVQLCIRSSGLTLMPGAIPRCARDDNTA
jgi:erythromycin esterase-like protein